MTKKFVPVNKVKRHWMEAFRKEMNLSTREMAQRIGGISFNHYADIEAGRRNPSIELSYKLAGFFGVEADVFFMNRTKYKSETE